MAKEIPYIPYRSNVGILKKGVDRALSELAVENVSEGMNCQLYAGCVIRSLGFYMPRGYRSSEMYEDPSSVLEVVDCTKQSIQDGDILGFCKYDETDPKKIHVGVAKITADGSVSVLHASRAAGKVVQNALEDMFADANHAVLCMARRPKIRMFLPNQQALAALGWFSV